MTANATLNASQFNAGLTKMQTDALKSAKGISSSIGLVFSKIGISALGGGLSFGAISGAMAAQLAKNQADADRMAELAGRRPTRIQDDLARGIQALEDVSAALVLILANLGTGIVDAGESIGRSRAWTFIHNMFSDARPYQAPLHIPDHAAQLAMVRRQQEAARIASQGVDQALVAGGAVITTMVAQDATMAHSRMVELQTLSAARRMEDVAAARRVTTLAGSTPIEQERITNAATSSHQNLVDQLNVEIRTLGMSRDQVVAFTHSLGENNPARRAEIALILEQRQAADRAITEGRAAMENSFALAREAMTPLEIYQQRLVQIGEASLPAAAHARLAAQALDQLNQTLESGTGAIGSLAAGSREVAEMLQGRREASRDVAAITLAAAEQQAQRDAQNLRELQQINRSLSGDKLEKADLRGGA